MMQKAQTIRKNLKYTKKKGFFWRENTKISPDSWISFTTNISLICTITSLYWKCILIPNIVSSDNSLSRSTALTSCSNTCHKETEAPFYRPKKFHISSGGVAPGKLQIYQVLFVCLEFSMTPFFWSLPSVCNHRWALECRETGRVEASPPGSVVHSIMTVILVLPNLHTTKLTQMSNF